MDEATFAGIVASKLALGETDETLFFGQYVGAARPAESFERYLAREIQAVDRQLQQRVESIERPPPPHLLTLKSWQHGFTGAQTRGAAEQARDDALFLRAQAWGHERLSAARWRACLDCLDRPARWLDLARSIEDEGRIVEANAALAAARWLDDEGTRAAIAAHRQARRPGLPARLVAQPDPTFRALPFGKRHWRAWDMKNYALLDLPSLLAFESDENFSVRTRVYRSLGQRPHPASIQALQEGTLDPHPFARAQAARSLGWCADPTATSHLSWIAEQDPHPEVRRAARQARQRIVGTWMYFGEWAPIMADRSSARRVARSLVADGLPYLAIDLLANAGGDDPETDAIWDGLEGLDPEDRHLMPELDYSHWFAPAQEEEQAIRGATLDDAALAEVLAHGEQAAREKVLLIVSAQGRAELRPHVEALTGAPGAIGWGARRAMRCMGWGSMCQRRARAVAPGV